MNKKWSEMTPTEKKLMIALWIYVGIALVFIALDLGGVWKNQVHIYMLSAFMLGDGIVTWKKNRVLSIVYLVFSVIWLVSGLMMG